MQIQLDFSVHPKENNKESEAILNDNKHHFSNQCKLVYDAMMNGERLTTATALLNYGIGDLRRRVKDLKDHNNINVQSEIISGRYKEYFINK